MFRYTKPCKICKGEMEIKYTTVGEIWGCNSCSYGENRTGGIKIGA